MVDLFDMMKEKGLEVPKTVQKQTEVKKDSSKDKKNVEPVAKKKVEPTSYKLPLSIYYAGHDHVINLEEYENKVELSKEEVLLHLQTNFGYRVLTEKRAQFEYDVETNELIVHLKNPSKGSSFDFGLNRYAFSDQTMRFVKKDTYGYMIGPKDDDLVDGFSKLFEGAPGIYLTKKVPRDIMIKILEEFIKSAPYERLAQIFFDRTNQEYVLHWPKQEVTFDSINREKGVFHLHNDRNTVLFAEIHSHGHFPALFSLVDNENEVDFLIYGVIGSFNYPQLTKKFRLGFNGSFHEFDIKDLFEMEGEN
jgi:hypothetical protein